MADFNEKKYLERRTALLAQMEATTKACETETRAFTPEEQTAFEEATKEIRGIDTLLGAVQETRALEKTTTKGVTDDGSQEELEVRAFASYIRGSLETRSTAVNMTLTDNGAIVPKTIAKRIIEAVEDKAPVFALATKFYIKGDLVFPVYDESTQKVSAAYATEFSALTSTAGKFSSITLSGYLAGALTKVSVSLVNNNDFDLVSFVVDKVAEAIADFLRKELILGTTGKMTGLCSTTNGVTTASSTAITADELITLQMAVPQSMQKDAVWLMKSTTLLAIRKLKDANNNYLLNQDLTTGFGWSVLGKPVHLDDNMADIAASAKTIVYGDLSGLYVKLTEAPNVSILREKYADEHAIGVIAWTEADSKIVESQKLAALTMKAST